jgi:hypothetical protein
MTGALAVFVIFMPTCPPYAAAASPIATVIATAIFALHISGLLFKIEPTPP